MLVIGKWVHIFSIFISCVSLLYGFSSYNAYILYNKRPKISEVLKIMISDFLYQLTLFTWQLNGLLFFSKNFLYNIIYIILFMLWMYTLFYLTVYFVCNISIVRKCCPKSKRQWNIFNLAAFVNQVNIIYTYFQGKHSRKEIKKLRQIYSGLMFGCSLFQLIFFSIFYYVYLQYFGYFILIPCSVTVILSLVEFFCVTCCDYLIFEWAYTIMEAESINELHLVYANFSSDEQSEMQ